MSIPTPAIASIAALAIMCTHTALAADATMGAKAAAPSAADQKLIKSALRAAPKKVSAAATIVVMGADGQMRTLREGKNGFTCMPDNPATPGPDPMCMDQAAWEWAGA